MSRKETGNCHQQPATSSLHSEARGRIIHSGISMFGAGRGAFVFVHDRVCGSWRKDEEGVKPFNFPQASEASRGG